MAKVLIKVINLRERNAPCQLARRERLFQARGGLASFGKQFRFVRISCINELDNGAGRCHVFKSIAATRHSCFLATCTRYISTEFILGSIQVRSKQKLESASATEFAQWSRCSFAHLYSDVPPPKSFTILLSFACEDINGQENIGNKFLYFATCCLSILLTCDWEDNQSDY